ncbi:MAG: hypothetical protein ABSB35_32035 [Bryobacteraceae bacterium]|jgi:hypothetical protein
MSNSLPSPTVAPWADPIAPELSLLKLIHRHDDGVITFHQKMDGDFKNLFAIRSEHLSRTFPEIVSHLEADVFMSMNAFCNRERGRHYLSAAQCRQSNRLRYLCACFTDLDFYKSGLTYGEVIGKIIDYQDQNRIPAVSVIIRSGRGLWLVWLLRDGEHPEIAPRAWPEKVNQYRLIQQKIHQVLAHLGADAQDALRLTRVPGSINSASGERVKYWIQSNGAGPYSYTLDQLAAQFDVAAEDKAFRSPKLVARSQNGRSRGPKALTAYRVNDFLTLLELRGGGFRDGCRNRAALYFAWLLRCQRTRKVDASEKVFELGKKCRPPLSDSECRDALKTGYRKCGGRVVPMSVRFQTVADWLDITPQESANLAKYPPASRFRQSAKPSDLKRTRLQMIEDRRAAIRQIATEKGAIPSLRVMEQLLEAAGYQASHVTVMNDYRALALRPPGTDAPVELTAEDPISVTVKFQCL